MDCETPIQPLFHLMVWTAVLVTGALHLTESSALSKDRALYEPFTRVSVTTPTRSSFTRAPRVKGFESNLKNFFYKPLGHFELQVIHTKKGLG